MAKSTKPTVTICGLPNDGIGRIVLIIICEKLSDNDYHIDSDSVYMDIHSSEIQNRFEYKVGFDEIKRATEQIKQVHLEIEARADKNVKFLNFFKAFKFHNNTLSVYFCKENFHITKNLF